MIRMNAREQLNILVRNVLPILRSVVAGFEPDPGTSDLDNEQPLNVRMDLGTYRKARALAYELEKY